MKSLLTHSRPHVIFRLFTVDDCNTEEGVLPKADSIVRFVVEENLFQILLTYYKERKECAKKLLAYYNRGLFLMIFHYQHVFRKSSYLPPDCRDYVCQYVSTSRLADD